MYQFVNKNLDKVKHFLVFLVCITLLLLLAIAYKNDNVASKKLKNVSFENSNFEQFKEYLLSKINSPFINEKYEVKSGDTIQKILKKFNVKNSEIQTVINKYKKYSNPNNLLKGDVIDLIVEKTTSGKNN